MANKAQDKESFKIDKKILDEVRTIAKRERRTVAGQVEVFICAALYLEKKAK